MMRYDDELPALLPTLSRGKHRSPRKGACFMEFASLLAGERWSDHPACTHPLLAAVARHVNDYTSDAARARLAELDGRPLGALEEQSREVLAQVPHAAAWAARFTSAAPASAISAKRFRQQAAPTIVRNAAQGIAQAGVPDPDGMLRTLLVQAVEVCAAWTGRAPGPDAAVDPAVWAAACQRTGGFTVADATSSNAPASR